MSRSGRDRFALAIAPSPGPRRGWTAQRINFLTGIAPRASPLSSAQRPRGHVFSRGHRHHEADGRFLSAAKLTPPVSTATGGTKPRDELFKMRRRTLWPVLETAAKGGAERSPPISGGARRVYRIGNQEGEDRDEGRAASFRRRHAC